MAIGKSLNTLRTTGAILSASASKPPIPPTRHWLLVAALAALPALLSAQDLRNTTYRIQTAPGGAVSLHAQGVDAPRNFAPVFTVLSRNRKPTFAMKKEAVTNYAIPLWKSARDGKDTHDLFEAADATTVTATGSELKDGKISWVFPDDARFSLAAELALPDEREPQVTVRLTPKQKGWYSVGYTGAPAVSPRNLSSLWQPLLWQERRFPDRPYLSIESMCSVPAVLTEQQGVTVGVAADPAESPFRLPTHHNSRFGVLLRNGAGKAQPMIFAPVPGGAESQMEAGQNYSFRFRLVMRPGDTNETFRSLARELFGFRDYRQNATCSLNETLENMIDYAMTDSLSGWLPEYKGSDYSTDVPGSVKNVSALHPLSVALVTDDADIYRRRALPMTEYLLSRQKYLFAPREEITHQSASYLMRGPAAEVSELAALHQMFGGRSEVFRHYAVELFDKPRALNLDMVSEGGSWQNALALFRLTGERQYLDRAVAGANDYIAKRVDRPQEDFSDVRVETGGQFWSDYAPKWVDLLELYEETKDPRHLQAAVAGAKTYSAYVWMTPRIPEGEVTVNKGGQVGVYYRTRNPVAKPMRAPEQSVPAWRLSQIGLTPEASRTHVGNPAIFLAHYAAYMLRLGHLAGDSFFHDIARSAVVGRYANFPGYDLNGEFTTVYSRPDYPRRPWHELTYNNIYYNHIWPHIALLMDYLVSDAFVKSDGQISFPSRYAQGYAFLFSKVYGDRPGTFYGDANVRLWLPRRLLETDNIQVNHVAGYGNGNFYLALLNQSGAPQEVTVRLNPDVVPVEESRSYPVRVWRDNRATSGTTVEGGKVTVSVPAHGITALAVDGLRVLPQFQEKVLAAGDGETSGAGFAVRETGIGKVTSMLLSMGPELTNAFVWLEATPKQATQATLYCRKGETETSSTDAIYPFEFSLPLEEGEREVELRVEATMPDGKVVGAESVRLRREEGGGSPR